jgi:hypothetical protein
MSRRKFLKKRLGAGVAPLITLLLSLSEAAVLVILWNIFLTPSPTLVMTRSGVELLDLLDGTDS